MQGFVYYTPTKVVFDKGAEQQVGKLVKKEGATKVLVHYGGQSAEKSGLLDRVYASLKEAGIEYVSLGGVKPNPHLSLVYEGIELCKKEGVDFLLAVGGGSVIDSAKAIGYGLGSGGDVWDFYDGVRTATAATPLGVVLTIAAAGSEMSNSSVITNDERSEKRGYGHNILGRPKFAVMNPELTLTVPPYQTAVGCADILMHTLERYFTDVTPSMGLTDGIASALMHSVMDNARLLSRNGDNYEARAEILWASSLSHNGLTACGNGPGDWAVHQLGHELSGKYDLAHGASLATVWGSWARYVYKQHTARFAQFATQVMDLPNMGSDEELALAGIEELEEFFWAIELPTSFKEAGISPTDADLEDMAEKCTHYGKRTIGVLKSLNKSDILAIYKMANS